ncbi:MAG: hypothetical protein ACKO0W_04925 [Planctomycetota bacterium]
MRRGRAARVARTAVGVGCLLAALVVAFGPLYARHFGAPHEGRDALPSVKPPVSRIDPGEALRGLESLDVSTDDGLREANALVAAAMAHYWPERDAIDWGVSARPWENLPLWTRLRVRALLGGSEAKVVRDARLERHDWRAALRLGVGWCSQQAIVLASYLAERGRAARVVGLGGHVVVEVAREDGAWILDPDYAVVVPMSRAEAVHSGDAVRGAYLAAGWPAEQAELVAGFYDADGNGAHGGRPLELTRRDRIAWMLGLGFAALLCFDPHRAGRSVVRAAGRRALRATVGILRHRRLLPLYRAGAAVAFVVAACAFLVSLVLERGPDLAESRVDPHPIRGMVRMCKSGVPCMDPETAIRALEALEPRSAEDIAEASRIVAAAMIHYWPERGDEDPSVTCGLLEDPALWLDMRRARGAGDDEAHTMLAWIERGRWRAALRMGVGLCSQHAIAIADYLREKGVAARVIGLDGHVVAAVETPQGEWILDPDYNVVLRMSLDEAARRTDEVERAYLEAGEPLRFATFVAQCFDAKGNVAYAGRLIGDGDPRRFEWSAEARRIGGFALLSGLALLCLRIGIAFLPRAR